MNSNEGVPNQWHRAEGSAPPCWAYAILNEMTTPLTRIGLRTFMLLLIGLLELPAAGASDSLAPSSSRIGFLRMSLTSHERIPIATLLAHPDRYQMREIRISGTVMAVQTEIIANRMICGSPHERTTLMVEDDSGQIEIIEHGACGKNIGALKAPMLKRGQQIDLLVHITLPTAPGTSSPPVDATIRYIDLARD